MSEYSYINCEILESARNIDSIHVLGIVMAVIQKLRGAVRETNLDLSCQASLQSMNNLNMAVINYQQFLRQDDVCAYSTHLSNDSKLEYECMNITRHMFAAAMQYIIETKPLILDGIWEFCQAEIIEQLSADLFGKFVEKHWLFQICARERKKFCNPSQSY
jgi:hypothetical protein